MLKKPVKSVVPQDKAKNAYRDRKISEISKACSVEVIQRVF